MRSKPLGIEPEVNKKTGALFLQVTLLYTATLLISTFFLNASRGCHLQQPVRIRSFCPFALRVLLLQLPIGLPERRGIIRAF